VLDLASELEAEDLFGIQEATIRIEIFEILQATQQN